MSNCDQFKNTILVFDPILTIKAKMQFLVIYFVLHNTIIFFPFRLTTNTFKCLDFLFVFLNPVIIKCESIMREIALIFTSAARFSCKPFTYFWVYCWWLGLIGVMVVLSVVVANHHVA